VAVSFIKWQSWISLINKRKMATGQGGILSALLLFAILFRLGLLQEPIYDAEYRRVNDLRFCACNHHRLLKLVK
jgi:hypothetical protein